MTFSTGRIGRAVPGLVPALRAQCRAETSQPQADQTKTSQPGTRKPEASQSEIAVAETRPPQSDHRGMVTAELACGTLVAVIVMIMMVWGVFLAVMQLQCLDTAAEVARQAARGDQQAIDSASNDAPKGAVVTMARQHDAIVVQVSLRATMFGGLLPAVPLKAEAEVIAEPGQAGPP